MNGKGKEKGKKNGGKGGILCSCDFFLGKAPANPDRKPQLPPLLLHKQYALRNGQ